VLPKPSWVTKTLMDGREREWDEGEFSEGFRGTPSLGFSQKKEKFALI